MATAGEMPMAASAFPTTSNSNGRCDPSEMESFINFEPVYPSPSLSPSADAKSLNPSLSTQTYSHPATTSTSPDITSSTTSNSFGSNPQYSQQLSFTAPSHQYSSYQQQTGLPMGGLANTMAMNGNPGMNMGFNDPSLAPADGFSGMNRMAGNMIPMNSKSGMPFVADGGDMDMDMDTTGLSQGSMFSTATQPSKTQFIDPNALGGQELSPAQQSAPVGRMYPGFHQQQAAKAKAAQEQRQQEIIRRQQQLQQPQQQAQAQPQQQNPQEIGSNSQPNRSQNKANRPQDPAVDERISRLLQQMRQSSVGSGDDSTPTSNPLPHPIKQKKDSQDMDEDERLLASEEGKKLSSKERRQLRNKVSARAFRSRRKEYIGQLEGELTAKTNETSDLQLRNRALEEENSRLTDLTRMLLSSQHFSSFLNDVGASGLPQLPEKTAPAATAPDSKPSQIPQGMPVQNPQTGLPMIAEDSFNMPSGDMHDSGWNSGIDLNMGNPNVFAVLEVPDDPVIDTAVLSGKATNSVIPPPSSDNKEFPPVTEMPPLLKDVHSDRQQTDPVEVEIDEDDPSLALFMDQPAKVEREADPSGDMARGVQSEKTSARFGLVVDGAPEEVRPSAAKRLEQLRMSIEGAFERVSMVTRHLE